MNVREGVIRAKLNDVAGKETEVNLGETMKNITMQGTKNKKIYV